jgi:hypothetical protein
MRFIVLVLAIAAWSFSAPATSASAPRILEPSSKWQLNFADDSCQLGRFFGTGDDRTLFVMERYQPGDEFYLAVAGKPMKSVQNRKRVNLAFGPHFEGYDSGFNTGSMGDLEPAIFITQTSLDRSGRDDEQDKDSDETSMSSGPGPDGQRVTAAEEDDVQWLDLAPYRGGKTLRLALGAMGKPLTMMRQCTDELLSHWGIDVAAHRTLSRQTEPIGSPGRWMDSDDFPSNALARGERGLVFFRLDVDEEGKVTGCHIQRLAGREEFKMAVCKAITKHAKSTPALDAAGKPIKSYWLNAVRFDYPN